MIQGIKSSFTHKTNSLPLSLPLSLSLSLQDGQLDELDSSRRESEERARDPEDLQRQREEDIAKVKRAGNRAEWLRSVLF